MNGDGKHPQKKSGNDAASFRAFLAMAAFFVLLLWSAPAFAQAKPFITINHDCKEFAISSQNEILCSEPTTKKIKKVVIVRDAIWLAEGGGKQKLIVDPDKFAPIINPTNYNVDSFSWSADGRRFAMNMTIQHPSSVEEPAGGQRVIALFDNEGHEIKVEGSKSGYIENGSHSAWLADNSTVVYLTGSGPYEIKRVDPSTGKTTDLFAGHTFDTIVWDAPNNHAFAMGANLSLSGREALVQLDLVKESVREIARIDMFQSQLEVSPAGDKIAFFRDADTLEVRDFANPAQAVRVRVGFGQYAWSPDEKHILLKRGAVDESADMVWVGLYDNTFVPALLGLTYHSFAIAPNGESIAVTEPGRAVLRVYSLR